jgi:ATP-dependent Lon protease
MAPKTTLKGKKGESKRKPERDSDSESDSDFNESDMSSTESSSESEKRSKRRVTKKVQKKQKKQEKEEETFDRKTYKKFLAQMFPSSFSRKNAEDEEDEEDEEEEKSSKKKTKKPSKKWVKSSKKVTNKKKRVVESESEEEDEDESDEEEDDEEEDDEEEDSEEEDEEDEDEESDEEDDSEDDEKDKKDKKKNTKNGKINIILSMGGTTSEEDEYNDYFGHEEDEEDDDDDDEEECDTDDEETFMKEKYEKIEQPDVSEQADGDSDSKEDKKEKKKEKKEKKDKMKEAETESTVDVESEYIELLELKKDLTKKLHKNPKSKILKKAIAECSTDIRKLVKDARKSNTKEYKKLIIGESDKPNEMNYFKTKMSNAEQLKIMRELKDVNQFMGIEKPYRLALLESSIPPKLKANAMQKINMLRSMDSCDPEYFKIKNWVDTFMRIPFCKYSNLSVSMNDGIEKCHEFVSNAKSILDKCVYGLDDAKLQILQMVGQWISNPQAMGTAIAIKGPPGTGKTTLVKDGISKILGREFVFIPLGGAGDSSFLEGHSYTYEGSTWGKIVQSLIDCKCMNPVFYFDELDKISDTPKGEEIVGILTHLTDTSQNSQFHDKYFSDVDFDLSKCLFIFSYNDESKVNPILKDRMYRIMTKGYDSKEKIVIARDYMLPKIREQVGFHPEEIIIPDETIRHIVSSKHLTQEEDGVRNMKRCLEIIHTKLNLFRLMKPDENLFAKDMKMEVSFPKTVTVKDVETLIKKEENQFQSIINSMYL